MEKSLEIIRKTRISLLAMVEGLSIEQLNKVPAGFNNNIIWNLGHLVATQQGVCYRRAGIDMRIDDSYFAMYKPESKPERFISETELETIKQLMFSTLDQFEADLKTTLFDNYIPWTTRYNVAVDNIRDAVTFLPFHEGLHMGYVMALKRGR